MTSLRNAPHRVAGALTACLALALPGTAGALTIDSGNLRFGVDDYGAIGSNFTNSTRLLGADTLPGTTNLSMVFAGFLYLPDYGYVGGDAADEATPGVFRGRTQLGTAAASVDTSVAGQITSTYTISLGALGLLDIEVKSVANGSESVTQSWTLSNHNNTALNFRLAYLLDMDIGATTSDDSGSVEDGYARGWDTDFGNPGAGVASAKSDPLLVTQIDAANEVGLINGRSADVLAALDGVAALPTADVNGGRIAFGFRFGDIVLGAGESRTFDIEFLGGGRLPVPEPATLALLATGLLGIAGRRRIA